MSSLDVFDSVCAKLRVAVNPNNIFTDLYENNLISDSEKADAADLPNLTAPQRMDKLLEAVRQAIICDPLKYDTFLGILGKTKKYLPLVKEMKGNVTYSTHDRALSTHALYHAIEVLLHTVFPGPSTPICCLVSCGSSPNHQMSQNIATKMQWWTGINIRRFAKVCH